MHAIKRWPALLPVLPMTGCVQTPSGDFVRGKGITAETAWQTESDSEGNAIDGSVIDRALGY